MMKYRYKPTRHFIPLGLEKTSWLQNHFRTDRIFVYFHTQAKNWVVSEWVQGRSAGWIEDLVIIGPNLHDFSREHVQKLNWLLKGPSVDPRKEIDRSIKDFNTSEQESDDHTHDVTKWGFKREREYHPAFNPTG